MNFQTQQYYSAYGGMPLYGNNRMTTNSYLMDLQQQQQQIGIKGRPVSSLEEVRASIIDFDGSIFYFPDIANQKIYTKQINLDGTPTLKVYQEVEVPPMQSSTNEVVQIDAVTKQEFSDTINGILKEIQILKGEKINESANATDDANPYKF